MIYTPILGLAQYDRLSDIIKCTCDSNFSLYQKIDLSNLECLNESEEGSGKRVFRPWQSRLDKGETDFVSSDCDAELLFNLPFTGNIKLKVNAIYINTALNSQTGPLNLTINTYSIYNL